MPSLLTAMLLTNLPLAAPPDETPGQPGEWGFRPRLGQTVALNAPGFVWRPQKGATEYLLQCSRDKDFGAVAHEWAKLPYNAFCPDQPFGPGKWHWRFAFVDEKGEQSDWGQAREFSVPEDAVAFPMPSYDEMYERVPKAHPRLFMRPEDVERLRVLRDGRLKERWAGLVEQCEKLLEEPPPVEEPPKYPEGMKRGSPEWRSIWWGNRTKTVAVLNGAATLAFTHLLGGDERYATEARRLLLAACDWGPVGATGYRYNDEAGMPFLYYASRTYTWLHPTLSEQDRQKVRDVLRVRGTECYKHLSGRQHYWKPYGSHANRAWHWLGEVAIAFLDEIPEARTWLTFATQIFFTCYPVWSDEDGGWHEGIAYWSSYIGRQTWWLDVMRAALKVNGYERPFFHRCGDYAMYVAPPGAKTGGLGDLTVRFEARRCASLMEVLARSAGQPQWKWYAEQGNGSLGGGYLGYLRSSYPELEAKQPTEYALSKVFRGTGLACLHTTLLDAAEDVHLTFKSSPFGSQSHGYNAQNSFTLSAFGEPIFIYSGRRDSYGSPHHKNWMWHTKSDNCITVGGESQLKHTVGSAGRIVAFRHSPDFDYVVGDAGKSYGDKVKRFLRTVLFLRPNVFVIYDELEAAEPSTFEWRLHCWDEMTIHDGQRVTAVGNADSQPGQARCEVEFVLPQGLSISQDNRFDPEPYRPFAQWNLTAATAEPARQMAFITVLRAHREGERAPVGATARKLDGGYACEVPLEEGKAVVVLRAADGEGPVAYGGVRAEGPLTVVRYDREGQAVGVFAVDSPGVEAR